MDDASADFNTECIEKGQLLLPFFLSELFCRSSRIFSLGPPCPRCRRLTAAEDVLGVRNQSSVADLVLKTIYIHAVDTEASLTFKIRFNHLPALEFGFHLVRFVSLDGEGDVIE